MTATILQRATVRVQVLPQTKNITFKNLNSAKEPGVSTLVVIIKEGNTLKNI